ncbi:MAG: hypothetical protein SF187_01245 [Deltaproteobacteria bacterium]|nr:hypothetical protein [Deltaproteobacteria bacterium]
MKNARRLSVLCMAFAAPALTSLTPARGLHWPLFLSAPVAHAAGLEQASKVLTLNREAMELYEELEFELAKRSLDEAVATIRSAQLESHMVAAKTYGNLGILFAAGFKDAEKAAAYFQSALAVKADYQLPKEFTTPEAVAALQAARSGPAVAKEAAAINKEPEAATTRAKGSSEAATLRCPSSGDVFAGDDVTLRCVTTPGFTPASVVLYYKAPGEEDFTALPMRSKAARNNKAMWSASIPARDVSGKWVPFYFEAKDQGGETLALAGRYESPNILTVKGEDTSVRKSARKRPQEDPANGDDEENPLEKGKKGEEEGVYAGRWFIGLGLGSGAGYSPDPKLEVYGQYGGSVTPGMLFAGGGHALPEVGYMVSDHVGISVQGRVQYIPRPNTVSAGGAFAAFVRALFFTGTGPSRFYGILQAGGGEGFRLKMSPVVKNAATGTTTREQDTVRGGPLVAGAGGGYAYGLTETLDFTLETNLLAGAPDFALAFDVNAGLRATF